MLYKEKKYVTRSVSLAQDHLTLRFFYYNQPVKHTKIDKQQYPGKGAFVCKGIDFNPSSSSWGITYWGGNRDMVQLTLSLGSDNNQFFPLQLHLSFTGACRQSAFYTLLSHWRKVKQPTCSALPRNWYSKKEWKYTVGALETIQEYDLGS